MAGETTTPAPDEELEDDQADGTPEGEQASEVEPEQPADQPAAEPDSPYGQAEFTRSQQAFSSLKQALGLDRKASRDDVIAAVQALQRRPAEDDDEADERSEREIAAEERAWNAELALQTAIYGEDFTGAMREAINLARTTNDPSELATAFAAFAMDYGARLNGAAPAATESDAEAGEDGAAQLDIGTSEGDRGPSARQAAEQSARRRESGVVGAIRGIFEAAGAGTRDST